MVKQHLEYFIDGIQIILCDGDLPVEVQYEKQIVAIDTELNRNLNPHKGKLCLIQLKVENSNCVYLIKFDINKPYNAPNLVNLMEDHSTPKLLHFANTDMQFISLQLNCTPCNILCTKLASKILRGIGKKIKHNFDVLVPLYLGYDINKSEQLSKWENESLTYSQIKYASKDVEPHYDLWHAIMRSATKEQQNMILKKCSKYPQVIQNELKGIKTEDPLYQY